MDRLISVNSHADIPAQYHHTPVEELLAYHNLEKEFGTHERASMLIGMCMDNWKYLHIPDNFAYIIRAGGANLRYSEFKVSYAIAIGNVKHITLIGHNHCGMVNLASQKNDFITGLVENAGWEQSDAEAHFAHYAPLHEIGNATDFTLSEAKRLREQYPNISIVPLFYLVEDNKLYFIDESENC